MEIKNHKIKINKWFELNIKQNSKIKFEEIELSSAETLFKLYDLETQNLISQIQ